MTEPRRFQGKSEFALQHKVGIPTLQEWAAHKRQSQAYRLAMYEAYRAVQPMPAGASCPCGSCADVGCDVCPCHRNRQLSVGNPGVWEPMYRAVEDRYLAQYTRRDAEFTLGWWEKYTRSGPAQYPNRLRAKDDQVRYAHELLHWDTVLSMGRPTHLPCGCP